MAQLLFFIRYDLHYVLNEEYLFCKQLESITNAENIFKIIDNYFSTIGLPWEKCVGICTNGAQAMHREYKKLHHIAKAHILRYLEKLRLPKICLTNYPLFLNAL